MNENEMYKIELWDMDNEHPYLATGEDGEVLMFKDFDFAEDEAKRITTEAYQKFDREYRWFVTLNPSPFARPLV